MRFFSTAGPVRPDDHYAMNTIRASRETSSSSTTRCRAGAAMRSPGRSRACASKDWDAARRHARHFGPWRVGSRLLAQRLYGHKGGNLDAVRRLGERVRSLLP